MKNVRTLKSKKNGNQTYIYLTFVIFIYYLGTPHIIVTFHENYYKDLQVGEGAKKPTVKPIQKETSTAGN